MEALMPTERARKARERAHWKVVVRRLREVVAEYEANHA